MGCAYAWMKQDDGFCLLDGRFLYTGGLRGEITFGWVCLLRIWPTGDFGPREYKTFAGFLQNEITLSARKLLADAYASTRYREGPQGRRMWRTLDSLTASQQFVWMGKSWGLAEKNASALLGNINTVSMHVQTVEINFIHSMKVK